MRPTSLQFYQLTLYTAAFKHCGIFFIKRDQTRGGSCGTTLFSRYMVETQSSFDKKYRVSIREYKFVKQSSICPCKRQRNGVLMFHTSFDKLRNKCSIIWWITEYSPKPRLF